MIQNIIWDVDGTLFDTYPPIARAFKSAIKHLGGVGDASIDWIEELSKISLSHCVSKILETEKSTLQRVKQREFSVVYTGAT
jgi:phosphoglycolate phosphatase-like HAD superfamily hydrolase